MIAVHCWCCQVHVILSEDAKISQINQQNQINTRLYHESSACFVVTALQRSSGSLNYDLKDRMPNETTSGNLPSLSVSTATTVCSGWNQRRFIWMISVITVFSCKSYTKTILNMQGLSHIAHTNAFSIASTVYNLVIIMNDITLKIHLQAEKCMLSTPESSIRLHGKNHASHRPNRSQPTSAG